MNEDEKIRETAGSFLPRSVKSERDHVIKPLFVAEKLWLSFPLAMHYVSSLNFGYIFPHTRRGYVSWSLYAFRNSLIGKEISAWLTKYLRR